MVSLDSGVLAEKNTTSRAKICGYTGLLVVLSVINWADKTVIGLVAQPLSRELGLSASQIGLLGSAFFLTFTIGGFFAGLLNKWMTLRWSLILLALAWAISMLPAVVVASFAVLLVSRMVLGFTEGPTSALVHAGMYTWHPVEKRGVPGAWLTGSASIAKIVVAPLLAVVVAAWGWRAAFAVLAAVSVVWCLIWLPTWKPGPYGEEAAARRRTPHGPEKVAWLKIILTPTCLGGAAAVFAMYGLATVVMMWLPSYFEVGLGFSSVQSGVMFALPSIAALFFLFLSTSIGDRLLARGASPRVLRGVVPAVGLLACGIALVALPLVTSAAVSVIVVSVGYGVGSIVFPLYNAALSAICPPKQTAGSLGIFMGVMSISGLIAPLLTGVVIDFAASPRDGYALAFQIFGVAAIVGAAIALLTVNPVRDARRVLATVQKT